VSILTTIAVWTLPEPSKLLCFDSLYEEFADNLYAYEGEIRCRKKVKSFKDVRLSSSVDFHALIVRLYEASLHPTDP